LFITESQTAIGRFVIIAFNPPCTGTTNLPNSIGSTAQILLVLGAGQ